jgi:hypothetical protein
MGSAARRAWEDYFSPKATVNSFVAWARLLLPFSHRRSARFKIEEYLTPRLVRAKLRYTFTTGATD